MKNRMAAAWEAVKGHRGWSGFIVGLVAGIAAGALAATLLPAVFAPPDGLEPGDLVILSGHDDSAGGQRHVLVDQWNQLHPENRARIEELPPQTDAQRSEMLARAQSAENPVDIYNLDVISVAEFADAGYLRPLRETAGTSGFLNGPLETCRYGGQLWALPFNSDAGLLYRRTDLEPAAPTTLDAMQRQIRGLFDAGSPARPLEAGYTGQLAPYEGLTVNALEAIWAFGGDVVDSSGRVVIDSQQTREALRWLASANNSTSHLILPASTTFDEERSTEAFRNGAVVFLRMWPVAYRSLRATAAGESAAPRQLTFDVSPLPGPSVLGGQDLAIASGSRHPRAAQALIEFLTSERSQQILFERGGFAATRELVYRDEEVRANHAYAPVLLDAIAAARPRPVTPHYARFSEIFRDVVGYALTHNGELRPDATSMLENALNGY